MRAQFEAATRRDFASALDAFDENVVLTVDAEAIPTAAGVFRGRAAVADWFAEWFSSFADYRFEVEEVRSAGERVFAFASHRGRGRASGVELDWSLAYAYTVHCAKVVRLEIFRDREDALRAVGPEG